jgi:MFS family permease
MSAHGDNPVAFLPGLVSRPSRARFGVLGFACTLSLVTYLDRTCIMRARVDMQKDLALTAVEMGWVFSAFTLGYMLFEVPGGWMGDRWGPRRVLTRIVLWWSLFTALTGCVWSFSFDSGQVLRLGPWQVPLVFGSLGLLLLVRFLFGAGEAGAYPNLTRVVGDWFPFRERALAQGSIWFSARLGGAIAPLVLGRLTAALGWRQAFWVLGALGVVWGGLFWRWFRDRPEQHPACNEAERRLIEAGTTAHRAGAAGHGLSGLVLSRAGLVTIVGLCWASFWVCFGWFFFPTWQPLYLEEVHHYQPDGWESEILSGLPYVCGAVGSLVGGGLSDRLVPVVGKRWGRSLVGLVGFLGAGTCMLGAGFVTATWQAVTLLSLAFLVNDLAIPVIWATCADVGGRFAGTVSGVMNTAGGVGAILSPLLLPHVRERLAETYTAEALWPMILAGLAVAWFLAALAWLVIDAGRRLDEPAPAPPGPGELAGPLPRIDGVPVSGVRSQEAGVRKTLTPDS